MNPSAQGQRGPVRALSFPPGWCYTADGLCQFWFGALQRAYWIKWHWKRTGTTIATTPHTGASRLSCTHTPETHWGVWARYKYIFAWPWPGSEETYSRWRMVIQHSNSRAFQTTQTVYTVYRIPLHGHYWPVLAVRNNGGPRPRMLLKRDEPQRAPAIKSQNKSAYPAACATLKTIECDYCLDIRCRKMPPVVLQTLIKRGNSHFSHSQVFNLLAQQIGENGNCASFTKQRLCWLGCLYMSSSFWLSFLPLLNSPSITSCQHLADPDQSKMRAKKR